MSGDQPHRFPLTGLFIVTFRCFAWLKSKWRWPHEKWRELSRRLFRSSSRVTSKSSFLVMTFTLGAMLTRVGVYRDLELKTCAEHVPRGANG